MGDLRPGLIICAVLVPSLLVLSALAACKKGDGATCFKVTDCDEGLACIGDSLRRCEKCDASEHCERDGQCTAKDGQCVATSNDECKKHYICTTQGGCTAKDGKCTVGGDADCQQSEACKTDGFCKAKGNNCIKDTPPPSSAAPEPSAPPSAPPEGSAAPGTTASAKASASP